jgi:hypothetical protein
MKDSGHVAAWSGAGPQYIHQFHITDNIYYYIPWYRGIYSIIFNGIMFLGNFVG